MKRITMKLISKIFFTIGLILSLAIIVQAQPLNRSTPRALIKTAEARKDSMDYFNALEYYDKYFDDNKKDMEVLFQMAELNFLLRDYKRSSDQYARVFKKDKKGDYASGKLNYAKALKMNEQYEDAMVQFLYIIEKSIDPVEKAIAENELAGCKMVSKLTLNERLIIANAGKDVNCATSDASPFLTSDGGTLYYASEARDSAVVLDGKTENYHMKLFSTKRGEKGWEPGKALSEQVNRLDVHNANMTISRDGKRMYFNRSVLKGNVLAESKIFVASYSPEGWGAATEVVGVNGDFVAKHPACGELFGKEVLFFVANMPGGLGGEDVYYSTMMGEATFSEPTNLGPLINTPFNEVTPFYQDGKLYFSTDGRPGLGGMDIFSSNWNGTAWSAPTNMGKGYNSSVDDMYYIVSKEGYDGALVSNRPGGRSLKSKTCCDDIWDVKIEKYKASVNATVYDAESKKAIFGVDVQLIEMQADKMGMTTPSNTGKTNATSSNLELEKSYSMIFNKAGFYPDTIAFNTVSLTKSMVYDRKVNLKPKEPEFEIYSTEEPIRLNNIYYDYDDDKILPDAEIDLTLIFDLMNQYPDMVIELGSHTDARGDDTYNQSLSQRRANSAKNWLVKKGIVTARIQPVGFGEKFILNKCVNLVECSDEEHRFNRRTEVKILSGPTSIKIDKKRLKGSKEEGVIINNPLIKATEKPSSTPPAKVNDPAKTSTTKPATPTKLLKFTDEKHFYGIIPHGDKRAFTYNFTNVSSVDVEIDLCNACECMTLDWTKGVIKPGEKGFVKALLDSTPKDKGEQVDDNINIILTNKNPETKSSIIYQLGYTAKVK